MTLAELRRFAVARSLFPPTTLERAIAQLGFVQADPIRAPARAQDLTLRHRVKGYRAGDLERFYPELAVEEGFFINYGFLRRADYLLMHPRAAGVAGGRRVSAIVEFIRGKGTAHPRDVEAQFGHGTTVNFWGGSSNATTHLLGLMHYRSLVRVARRDNGIRVYAVQDPAAAPKTAAERQAQLDRLVDLVVQAYAPLPAQSLQMVVARLRYATPQWQRGLKPALARAKARLTHARVDGLDWYWPASEPADVLHDPGDEVRLLSPFDPIVWDRRRFELFWGWAYRFEAYTPAKKRKLGYYALPLLWRDRVIGWCNASVTNGRVACELGFVKGRPRDKAFTRAFDAEVARLRTFLQAE